MSPNSKTSSSSFLSAPSTSFFNLFFNSRTASTPSRCRRSSISNSFSLRSISARFRSNIWHSSASISSRSIVVSSFVVVFSSSSSSSLVLRSINAFISSCAFAISSTFLNTASSFFDIRSDIAAFRSYSARSFTVTVVARVKFLENTVLVGLFSRVPKTEEDKEEDKEVFDATIQKKVRRNNTTTTNTVAHKTYPSD